jgi:hypothetical protein
MPAKEALILRDDQNTLTLAEARRRNDNFCRRRGGENQINPASKKRYPQKERQ